jgi:hypothetical protein
LAAAVGGFEDPRGGEAAAGVGVGAHGGGLRTAVVGERDGVAWSGDA